MKNIIYTYDQIAFNNAALAHVDKLTFNTRSEYLAWVAQWQEEYKHAVAVRKYAKLNRFSLPVNVERANKQKEKLEKQCDPKRSKEFFEAIRLRMLNEYGIRFWNDNMYHFSYAIIIYLLVIRKASKLRAAKKREERIAAEKVAV